MCSKYGADSQAIFRARTQTDRQTQTHKLTDTNDQLITLPTAGLALALVTLNPKITWEEVVRVTVTTDLYVIHCATQLPKRSRFQWREMWTPI